MKGQQTVEDVIETAMKAIAQQEDKGRIGLGKLHRAIAGTIVPNSISSCVMAKALRGQDIRKKKYEVHRTRQRLNGKRRPHFHRDDKRPHRRRTEAREILAASRDRRSSGATSSTRSSSPTNTAITSPGCGRCFVQSAARYMFQVKLKTLITGRGPAG